MSTPPPPPPRGLSLHLDPKGSKTIKVAVVVEACLCSLPLDGKKKKSSVPYHSAWKYNHPTGINTVVKFCLYFPKVSDMYVEIACGTQTVLIVRTAETAMIFVRRRHWNDKNK